MMIGRAVFRELVFVGEFGCILGWFLHWFYLLPCGLVRSVGRIVMALD